MFQNKCRGAESLKIAFASGWRQVSGHDFSRAAKPSKNIGLWAPRVSSSPLPVHPNI